MKKIVALVAVLFSVVVPVQSQASAGERIVIIDDYFDTSVIPGPVESVCVALSACNIKSSQYSHGTQMALIARQQNPDATLVLLQAATVSKKGVIDTNANVLALINGLKWTTANSSQVSAVSFSRWIKTASKPCTPIASGITPVAAASAVSSEVLSLKNKGIPFLAASGNHNGAIDFPACIPDAISVGAIGRGLGDDTKGGGFHSMNSPFPADTILSSQTVRNTTSSATVTIAARYKSLNLTTSKVVSIP